MSTAQVEKPLIRVKCDNCNWKGTEEECPYEHGLFEIWQRLEPGGEVPVGECPECGCLTYLIPEAPDELTKLREANKELVEALQKILDGCDHVGVWVDEDGRECQEHDDGAEWREFDLDEQNAQMGSVVVTCTEAIAKHGGAK